MKAFFTELWGNQILLTALAAWLIAQIIKAALYLVMHRTFSFERLVGSGGMPSSHAATVCALTTAVCKQYGPGSFEFAICLLFAAVVLYDARGVRLETGKQAVTITAIIDHFIESGEVMDLPKLELKEMIGHTAVQVLVGGVLGILIGLWLG